MKLPREMGTKPSQRSASTAAVLVHSPVIGQQINAKSRAAQLQLEGLLSRDEAHLRGVQSIEQHDQHEGSRETLSESRATSLATPENDCSDPSTLSWEVSLAVTNLTYVRLHLHALYTT